MRLEATMLSSLPPCTEDSQLDVPDEQLMASVSSALQTINGYLEGLPPGQCDELAQAAQTVHKVGLRESVPRT